MSSIENLQIEAKIDKIFDGKKGFKAFASITICNSFVVHGIKVIESQDGFVIRMPYTSFTDKYGKKQFRDIAHPISKEARQIIQECILAEYNKIAELTSETGSENA